MKWRRAKTGPTLADHLAAAGRLDAAQAEALAAATAGGREAACLAAVRLGIVSERRLMAVLAERLEVPAVGAETLAYDEEALAALPPVLQGRVDIWPLRKLGATLSVAMADPSDAGMIAKLAEATGLAIRPMLAPLWALRDVHRRAASLQQLHGNLGGDRELVRYLVFFENLREYRFESVLGSGGFGLVCRCWQASLNRPVAVKVLNPDWNPIAQVAERFRREGQIIARLDHPNIIRVLEQGERDGFGYIVMEYFEGRPLNDHLAQKDFGRKLTVLQQVCHALDYAHKQGVIHRDIKPANILANAQGAVKLLDFGIAHDGGDGSGLTSVRVVLGTPKYMAPELAQGAIHATEASDLYSFGVMAYEILCGERFEPGSLVHPTRAEGRIPRFLGDALLACLSPDPARRPHGCARMAEVIQQALDQLIFGAGATRDGQTVAAATRQGATAVEGQVEPLETLREEPGVRTILAFNRQLGSQVVIKVLDRPRNAERLAACAELRDLHIGELYGVGHQGRLVLTVTEHLPGGSLAGRLGQPAPPRQIVEIISGIVNALQAAQRSGLTHGNLHPGNVLFSAEQVVKVVDFGAIPEAPARMERFAAPPALEDPVGRDRHALGAIAYELITGKEFPGGLAYARYYAPLATEPRVHPLMKYFLGRLWQVREPDPPYADYQAMLLDLARIQNRLDDRPDWSGESDGATVQAAPAESGAASLLGRALAALPFRRVDRGT